MATDRRLWDDAMPYVLARHLSIHPVACPSCSPTWRDVLRVHTNWHISVYISGVCSSGVWRWSLVWIDAQHGVQTFSRENMQLYAFLLLWLQYLQLRFRSLLVNLAHMEWLYEAFLSDFQHLHQQAFSDFKLVLLYELVRDAWGRRLAALA